MSSGARNDQSGAGCSDGVAGTGAFAGAEAVGVCALAWDEGIGASAGTRNDQSGSGCLTGVAGEGAFIGADAVGVEAGAGGDGAVV